MKRLLWCILLTAQLTTIIYILMVGAANQGAQLESRRERNDRLTREAVVFNRGSHGR